MVGVDGLSRPRIEGLRRFAKMRTDQIIEVYSPEMRVHDACNLIDIWRLLFPVLEDCEGWPEACRLFRVWGSDKLLFWMN